MTYRARDQQEDRDVAVKEMLVRKADSLKALELFEREAAVLERLDHPGIPKYIDDFVVEAGKNSAFYLVQEFIDGVTARTALNPPVSPELAMDVVAQVADILTYLHSLAPPVIHRDIKPENILIGRDERAYLIDFGSVRNAVEHREGGSTVAGTFGYMAPEQLMGRALPASDVYALGATLITLLSGQDPSTFLDIDRKFELDQLNVSRAHRELVKRLVENNPEKRPSTGDLAELLRMPETAMVLPTRGDALAKLDAKTSALVLGPRPRKFPKNFRRNYLQRSQFNQFFGGMFLLLGTAVPCFVGAILALAGPFSAALIPLLVMIIFGGIGVISVLNGRRGRQIARNVWQHGNAVRGRLTAIDRAPIARNGRHARRYVYQYEVAGRQLEGFHDTWNYLAYQPGEEVVILHDEDAPEQSLIVI